VAGASHRHAVLQQREVEAVTKARTCVRMLCMSERISVNVGLLLPLPLVSWKAETQIIPYRTVESSNSTRYDYNLFRLLFIEGKCLVRFVLGFSKELLNYVFFYCLNFPSHLTCFDLI
jgi:hypothetical protein